MLYPLINPHKKFIVCWNAKAGCTAVKRWYLQTMGVDPDSVNPHVFLAQRAPKFNTAQLDELYPDYYRFIVCRNPWKRIVSYYKNKKVAVWWKNSTWPIDIRQQNMNSEDFTFRDLVNFVCDTPDQYLEQHLQSQTSELGDMKFDQIVRLEDYADGMNQVCDHLGIDVRDFRNPNKTLETENKVNVSDLPPKEFDTDNMPSYDCFYDDELRDMVEQYFKNDIEYFSYKFED
tara:strand:+ start:874 stop:1566 length:693 start_codon:yes stop_codon:yes gene_type:complete